MKKRILFVLPSFRIGGTTVSTRNLISVLNKDKFDIIVWAMDNNGLLHWMYGGLHLLNTCFPIQALALNSWRDERNLILRLLAASLRFFANHSRFIREVIFKYAIRKCVGRRTFDTVIACEEGLTSEFVSYIRCPNRLAWVRCDYKRYFRYHNGIKEGFYNKYNHIVCVAKKTCASFKDIYSELNERVVCIHNPQDSELIQSQAKIDDGDSRFRTDGVGKVMVSLGRLAAVKRFDRIPSIALELKDKNLNFVWYIIGDGEEKDKIRQAIIENGVEDSVIMLGAKSNPHFYIKNADLYVCLSSSEACPRVVNEAKILGTPVVSADFPTIYEYITDSLDGCIAPIESVGETIIQLFRNKSLYSSIQDNIKHFSFDNKPLIVQLEKIL